MCKLIKRGEIYYADLSPVIGSEQGGIRPVLVLQNDIGNKYSPTIIAAAITSQLDKAKLPTHIALEAGKYGLPKNSVVLLEQIRTLDKRRLKEKIGELPLNMMTRESTKRCSFPSDFLKLNQSNAFIKSKVSIELKRKTFRILL